MATFSNAREYIAAQSVAAQARLRELQAVIRAAIPDAQETISYGMPTYKFSGGAVYFGAAKRHVAIYGVAIDGFGHALRAFVTSRGTVRLPLDRPIPTDLVREMVLATVSEKQRAARSR